MQIKQRINKRIAFLSIMACILAFYFWIVSRYPALNDKAGMMREAPTYDVLTLGPWFKYSATDSLMTKVLFTTLNWYNSNWRGMLFGLVLAGIFLAISREWKGMSAPTGSSFKDRLKGLLLGVPLGLCVNCAAPVATTLYRSTGSSQLSLSVLLSSPTLNFVVLGMVLSMFPPEIAAPKILFTLVAVFGAIPLLSRLVKSSAAPAAEVSSPITMEESFFDSIKHSVLLFLESFVEVIKKTLPLMLLTGLLAAILIHTVPMELVLQSTEFNFATALGAAFLGTLLPLPVAADILIAQSIFTAGFSPALVSVFLFTLGTYSIYPLMLVGKEMSKKLSLAIFALVVVLGVISGYTTEYLHPIMVDRSMKILEQTMSGTDDLSAEEKADSLSLLNVKEAPPYSGRVEYVEGDVVAASVPFSTPQSFTAGKHNGFNKMWGSGVGLLPDITLHDDEIMDPISYGRGIASGDIDQDGWVDIVYATRSGPEVYLNNKNGTFSKAALPRELKKFNVLGVALVDFDNSGWPDLYLTTLKNGPIILKNDRKVFQTVKNENMIYLPSPKGAVTIASAFADINRSGQLSILQGNWYFGNYPTLPVQESAKYVLMKNPVDYRPVLISQPESGSSLTAMFTDINRDGHPDAYIANDFNYPDQIFLNSKNNSFQLMKKGETLFSGSPKLTMSIDSADVNNDGEMDYFAVGMSDKREGTFIDACQALLKKESIDRCVELANHSKLNFSAKTADDVVSSCKEVSQGKGFKSCVSIGMAYLSINLNEKKMCDSIPQRYELAKFTCGRYFARLVGSEKLPNDAGDKKDFFRSSSYGYENDIPQKKTGNTFFLSKNGKYEEVSKKNGTEDTGWAWNAKFADLDNDGWQDLYVANGFIDYVMKSADKRFFRNQGDGSFKAEQNEFNLGEILPFSAYTYADINNDGNLDIVTNATMSEPRVFVNKGGGRSIMFELVDMAGNRSCYGCQVKIYYGENGKKTQLKELKAGGGFLSFDAPVMHFGLGADEKITALEITWSTGEKTTVSREHSAGRKYRIVRKKA